MTGTATLFVPLKPEFRTMDEERCRRPSSHGRACGPDIPEPIVAHLCLLAVAGDWKSAPALTRARILRCTNRLTRILARLPRRRRAAP